MEKIVRLYGTDHEGILKTSFIPIGYKRTVTQENGKTIIYVYGYKTFCALTGIEFKDLV